MSESERARSLRSTGAAGVSSEYKLAIAKPAVVTKAHPKLAACTGAEPIDCTGTEVERPVVTGACSNKDHLARRTRCRHVRATSWANDESLSSSSVATLLSRSGSQHSSKAGAPEARSVSSTSRPACKEKALINCNCVKTSHRASSRFLRAWPATAAVERTEGWDVVPTRSRGELVVCRVRRLGARRAAAWLGRETRKERVRGK